MTARVAFEIGAECTDVVIREQDGRIRTHKVPARRTDPAGEIEAALEVVAVDLSLVDTVIQNAVSQLRLASDLAGIKVGLLTTLGFRDTLEIMWANRPHPFDLQCDKPAPLVPRELRKEVNERVDARGAVLRAVDPDEAVRLADELVEQGCRAVAVCFLFAGAEPTNERTVKAALAEAFPELPVTVSSELSRSLGEFERTSTTVLNALANPVADRELRAIEVGLRQRGFAGELLSIQSNGGVTTARGARQTAVATLRTQGVGGIVAAQTFGTLMGEGRLLTVDIGGDSTVASVVEGSGAAQRTENEWEGWPIQLPAVDFHEIRHGVGTTAWVDEVGFLQVGGVDPSDPLAVGPAPGPSVTQAFIVLGALLASRREGAAIGMRQARQAIEPLARKLEATVPETASGIVRITNARIAAGLREAAMSRGYQPRDLTLLAYGGGGGLHAAALARELDLPRAIVPVYASVFSALGMTLAPLTYDFSCSLMRSIETIEPADVRAAISDGEEACRGRAFAAGITRESIAVSVNLELRYEGQKHSLQVPLVQPPSSRADLRGLARVFGREHQHFFGYTMDVDTVIDTVRVRLYASQPDTTLAALGDTNGSAGVRGRGRTPTRQLRLTESGRATQWPVYQRSDLTSGMTLNGPAVVSECDGTTLVPEDDALEVDAFGNLILYIDRRF